MELAILIDVENMDQYLKHLNFLNKLLDNLATEYTLSIRKAYAPWHSPQFNNREFLGQFTRLDFEQVQVMAPVSGKNSSDIHMAVDAIDLIYQQNLDGIVLVSGDSDFGALFRKLRERRKIAIGCGPRGTFTARLNRQSLK